MSQKITKVLGLIALTAFTGLMDAQTHNWKPAGPVYSAGRARNMVVNRLNTQILYVGSASSGIFKSVNGGVTWAPINDQATIRNISYLAQTYGGTIYAGTGEGFLRAGQKTKAQPGTGLYRLDETTNPASLDLVVSSTLVGTVINRVACNPNNDTHIAIATNLGIFVSTNGGAAFTQVTLPSAPTGSTVSGQDVKFDANGILYCSIGAEAGTSSLTPSAVYKSLDATSLSTFTVITPQSTVLPDMNYGRIELGISASNPNVIYASCANKYVNVSSATLKGLFVSYDAGSTWGLILQGSAQLDPLSNGGTKASGDYAHVIVVSPTNPNIIFYGGYSFYIFERTGGSDANPIGIWRENLAQSFFSSNQSYLHENIHDIKFIPGTPAKFYFVTDAGIFRSIDLLNAGPTSAPSYQPFYKGMITGQFNSVSIEKYPIGDSLPTTRAGMQVTPYSGFVGGTGGNGLTYFSGRDTLVTKELTYLGGEVYGAEYSKILPNAVITSVGDGRVFRSTNIKTSNPTLLNVNKYTDVISKIAPNPESFSNPGQTIGTPFKLWEYYGQRGVASPDSIVFYNDTVRYQASMAGIPELTTKTTFTFSTSRPNEYALIDSVVIRTGTVTLPISNTSYVTVGSAGTPFNGPQDGQTIYARTTPKTYSASNTPTVLSSITIGAASVPVTFTLDPIHLIDNFSVTFTAPPFATKTITQYPANVTGTNVIIPDAAVYYRVFATVFYKYKAGDVVSTTDNNISTRTNTYTSVLTQSLSWRYGNSLPNYTIASTSTIAVTNPTYVLTSNASLNNSVVSQSSPNFTVSPYGKTSYTIQQFGIYTLNAVPINYTLAADPIAYTITATPNGTLPTPVYTLSPGNFTQTSNVFVVVPTATAGNSYTVASGSTISTFTFGPTSFSINPAAGTQTTSAPNVFAITVNPTVATTYTLTQTTGTLSQDTFSAISSPTYVLNPGNITQIDNPVFSATITALGSYTITGTSSNTLAAANTTTVYTTNGTSANLPIVTVSVITTGAVTLNKFNPPVKIPAIISSRLAMIINNTSNTGSADAIVVSKNPLALNDPLSLIRVSQSGALSDDAAGNPTTTVVNIVGKPILLEWSKSGTEIYFATNANKLYRVSHITTLMDLSPSSYSGKFYTDIFKYAAPINSGTINPVSPYRTTLIGSFDKPITSISTSKDSSKIVLTFNGSATGTTSTIMYSTNNARVSNESNINWQSRQGTLPSTVAITYCSLIEKNDSKKVFLGTDNGMYYTSDISASSPNWVNANLNSTSKLPNVQIFDIKQQTLDAWDCYNSGQIYVATNGRGVWTTGTYFAPYTIGIQENELPAIVGKNLSLYPNPTNGNVNVSFTSIEGETATLQIMDISGRIVQTENLGKLNTTDVNYNFTTSALNSGVYIVNINSNSGIKRVTKLIVTK